jgi:chemotaxis signal transduction protein
MQDVDELVPHMRRVMGAQRDLRDLGLVWQMIESSAAISCPEESDSILPTLISTRERFDDLQLRLVEQMAGENCAALGDELGAKAQCAIDILVRNLFERTADVGFLSTDAVVRDFCAAPPAQRDAMRPSMVQRLREYQAKYSVYDDVVLLAADGLVLARLEASRPLARSADPIVAEALSAAGYVERFRTSDLAADAAPALLYAQRIQDHHGKPLGVLVLRFRFVDEMHYVFASMADARNEMALVLLDEHGQVIVSNDDAHVPVGARLAPVACGGVALTSFAGREYLAVTRASAGYQGYGGPPWRAQAMVSLLTAFRHARETVPDADRDVPLDNAALHAINDDADEINRDLRRVVWNGQLMAGAQAVVSRRLKAMLQQVNQAGRRTRERVAIAIRDLHRTSLDRARHQAADLARLAADIMDRNLYERANDCRWWALSPALRQLLAAPAGADNAQALNALLDHINGLYTVYSRLVVFDADGVVRGVSRHGDGSAHLGARVDPVWPQAVAALRDTQHYHVSPYADTPLHAHGPTYVYLAAVRAEDPARTCLGGIAIVFHAARELQAMLRDVLGERQGMAAFVDASGQVLAATDPGLAAGLAHQVTADRALLSHGGAHFACSRARTRGYREFKTSDGYDNQVHAVVALRLGASDRRRASFSDMPLAASVPRQATEATQVAVFQIGAMRCALPTRQVVEAVSPRGMVRVPPGAAPTIGLLEVQVDERRSLVPVVCAREHFGVHYPSRSTDGVVLLLRMPGEEHRLLGLRVDDVLSVLDVDRSLWHPAPSGFGQFAPWLSGVLEVSARVGERRETVLLQMLDLTRFDAPDVPRHAEPEPAEPELAA